MSDQDLEWSEVKVLQNGILIMYIYLKQYSKNYLLLSTIALANTYPLRQWMGHFQKDQPRFVFTEPIDLM